MLVQHRRCDTGREQCRHQGVSARSAYVDSILRRDALQIPLRGRIFFGKPEVHFSGKCSKLVGR